MSIFGIITITFLATFIIFGIAMARYVDILENNRIFKFGKNEYKTIAIIVLVCVLLWFMFTLIGIGINTECHRVWIANYEAQKATIEMSIDSEVLSGLERIDLVNKAAELNGELAKRKTEAGFWHHVSFGDVGEWYIYLEPIQIK